jgi:chemotaxis protein MotB
MLLFQQLLKRDNGYNITGDRDKMIKRAMLVIAGVILITGCVSTKEYEVSLNNANTLEAEKADLEERLQDTMARLNKEKSNRESVEREMTTLKTNRDDLVRHKESLLQINQELNETVAELSQEKLQTIKEKDRTITELIQEKEKAIAQLKGTYDNLVTELNEEIKKGEIEVTQLKDKLTLSMVDKILFDSGSAAIKQNGKDVLARVADILRNITDKQIRIEGHTDNVQIGPVLAEKFPTNWELSTARSTTVVRYLQQQEINSSFLSATGYSEFRPVDTNETEEGRAKNRRIEIVLIPLESEHLTNLK